MSLAKDGFKRVKKPYTEYQEIDKEIAEGSDCDICGRPMNYEGWVRGTEYIALAVCYRCKIAEGF